MKGILRMLAVLALLGAGCAMATSDRLQIVDVESEGHLLQGDMVYLYDGTGWMCSASVGEIEDGSVECPRNAPDAVSWAVRRGTGLSTGYLASGVSDVPHQGCSNVGCDDLRIIVCQ